MRYKSLNSTRFGVSVTFNFCKRKIQIFSRVIYVQRVGDGMRPQGFGVKFIRMAKDDYEAICLAIDSFYKRMREKRN